MTDNMNQLSVTIDSQHPIIREYFNKEAPDLFNLAAFKKNIINTYFLIRKAATARIIKDPMTNKEGYMMLLAVSGACTAIFSRETVSSSLSSSKPSYN